MAAIDRPAAIELKTADAGPEKAGAAATERVPAAQDAVEYDRRGVALPRRARVGGIITPQ